MIIVSLGHHRASRNKFTDLSFKICLPCALELLMDIYNYTYLNVNEHNRVIYQIKKLHVSEDER